MQNYTLIVASAYGDDSADIYVVLAPSAKAACDHVQALDAKLKDRPRSVLFLMDGEVRFQPTLFKDDGKPQYEGPTVIDLRPAWSQAPMHPLEPGPLTYGGKRIRADRQRAGVQVGRMSGPPLPEGMSHGGAQAARETPKAKRRATARTIQPEPAPAPPAATEPPLVSAGGQKVRRTRKKAAAPFPEAPMPALAAAVANVDPRTPRTRGKASTGGRTSLITGKERPARRSKPSTGGKG